MDGKPEAWGARPYKVRASVSLAYAARRCYGFPARGAGIAPARARAVSFAHSSALEEDVADIDVERRKRSPLPMILGLLLLLLLGFLLWRYVLADGGAAATGDGVVVDTAVP